MSETPQNAPETPNSPEEIAEVLEEFEKYRQRLVNDTITAAKKAKMPKSVVMAQLEPELQKIDGMIENLRKQQAELNSAS